MWGWICQVCLIIVASEASDLYEMPFIFHSHTHRTSFKLNEGGGAGEGKFWISNYVQRKAPTDMKFGLQVHYSAMNKQFLIKFTYLPHFWPYSQKYIFMHINFYVETKMAKIMNDITFPRYFGPGNMMLVLF